MPKMTNEDQPWIDNYPPLRDFLREHKARCDFQLRIGGTAAAPSGYIEQWRFPNGRTCVVVVHSKRAGWNISTDIDANDIPATRGRTARPRRRVVAPIAAPPPAVADWVADELESREHPELERES